MIALAKHKTLQKRLKNIDFIYGDVAKMPFGKEEFDGITIAFGFRNLTFENPDVQNHLKEMNRILKREGKLIILESGIPTQSFVRLIYKFYLTCVLIPLGGIISGSWHAYRYLAKSSGNFFNLPEVDQLLTDYGFKVLESKRYFMGAANLVIAEKQ
ncbi:Demethylmenaquinone methyltransferase [subsurface metagenome]